MPVMRAWRTTGASGGLEAVEDTVPEPAADEVLVEVEVCGICRTDLHVIDHEIPVHRPRVTPGHQAIGTVVDVGDDVTSLQPGARVGVAWLRRTCGECAFCRRGAENLCPYSEYTGWDADGGFAGYLVAPAAYVYPIAADADALETAPLLCAGIIGYRALQRAQLPPGGTLGIYGFGSSAHVTAQLAMAGGARVFAMTRGVQNRELARELGVDFVGEEDEEPPEPLDAAIVFARRARPGRAAGDRERRHGGARRHRDVGPPAALLHRVVVPRARPAHRHGEHPGGRCALPRARAEPPAAADGDGGAVRRAGGRDRRSAAGQDRRLAGAARRLVKRRGR